MNNIDKVVPAAKTVLESVKRIFSLLSSRHYWAAIKEFFNLADLTYTNHLKGKFVTIKGHQIPLTTLILAALLIIYWIYPQSDDSDQFPAAQTISKAEMQMQANYFNGDGVIIDKMHKCDEAVCGVLENTKDKEVKELTIPVAFFDQEGILVFESRIQATNVPPHKATDFQIPSDVPFDYFKLGVVIVNR
jgi:hypothetical protein